MSVAYGAYLHYSPVVLLPYPCGIVEIFMLNAAGYAAFVSIALNIAYVMQGIYSSQNGIATKTTSVFFMTSPAKL
ncbi:MAG: hypothetical protein IKN68_06980 [Spirochaetia bacterium]|nr:hypothetical protein [Spirochaetia bacterium]